MIVSRTLFLFTVCRQQTLVAADEGTVECQVYGRNTLDNLLRIVDSAVVDRGTGITGVERVDSESSGLINEGTNQHTHLQ